MGLLRTFNIRNKLNQESMNKSKDFANTMRSLAEDYNLDSDFSYICGLLHNIGDINKGGINNLDTYYILIRENMNDIATIMAYYYDIQSKVRAPILTKRLKRYVKLMKETEKVIGEGKLRNEEKIY